MSGGKIEILVFQMAEKAAELLGYEIVDVNYVKEGGNRILRIFIDREGGISTDDCEKMSRSLERMLDETDPIEGSYSLEVSSPGLDRLLKTERDFERFKGRLIDIKLYAPKNGAKKHRGELINFNSGEICILNEKGESLLFTLSEAASVKLAVIF